MSRGISDVQEAQRFIGIGFADLVATLLLIAGAIGAMVIMDWQLALIALAPIPILTVLVIRFGRNVRGQFKAVQEQLGVVSQTMQESPPASASSRHLLANRMNCRNSMPKTMAGLIHALR